MPFQRIRSPRRTSILRKKLGRKELIATLNKFGEEKMKPAFKETVVNWETDVQFIKKIHPGNKRIEVWVEAHKNKRIYGYVDKGTRPHIIRPKRAKALRFTSGYAPKTLATARSSLLPVGSGASTGDVIFTKVVNHPGTDARKFSEEINKRLKPDFKRTIDAMFRRLARQLNM